MLVLACSKLSKLINCLNYMECVPFEFVLVQIENVNEFSQFFFN